MNKETTKKLSITQQLNSEAVKNLIKKTVGEKTEELTTALIAIAGSNDKLEQCTIQQIAKTAFNAVSLNLSLNLSLGHCYIIPYETTKNINGKWVKSYEPTFQISYLGYLQLIERTGLYKKAHVTSYYTGEVEYNKFTDEFKFNNAVNNEVAGFYGFIERLDGVKKEIIMSIDELEDHAMKYSISYKYDKKFNKKSSPWTTEKHKMCEKTVLKKLIKRHGIIGNGGISPLAFATDGSNKDGKYIDNEQIKLIEENTSNTPKLLQEQMQKEQQEKEQEQTKINNVDVGEEIPFD